MVKFFRFDHIWIQNQDKVIFFLSKNISKFLLLPLPSGLCMFPLDFMLERDLKNIFYRQCDIELYRSGPRFLYYLLNINMHMESFSL